jgi:hypothetical protein
VTECDNPCTVTLPLHLAAADAEAEGLRLVGEAIGSPGSGDEAGGADLKPAPVGALSGLLRWVPGALHAVRVINLTCNINLYDERYVQHVAEVIGTPGALQVLPALSLHRDAFLGMQPVPERGVTTAMHRCPTAGALHGIAHATGDNMVAH